MRQVQDAMEAVGYSNKDSSKVVEWAKRHVKPKQPQSAEDKIKLLEKQVAKLQKQVAKVNGLLF